ncbi:hypothetical protein HY967_03365 [Candidatus Jorgensenbacteria bacterium]|nr:hypothetical protein [Candidatus Jorgensenbacteria bacterium]
MPSGTDSVAPYEGKTEDPDVETPPIKTNELRTDTNEGEKSDNIGGTASVEPETNEGRKDTNEDRPGLLGAPSLRQRFLEELRGL